ncbi:class I SAM-dependent methyltransferase [Inquilinus sp. OTU3971]|uniref:class I SAM-dependent methyltransferase n=1 Tax=Inquilinus sp. OTU3971 TaxID=3043855 RepID=UPI00313EC9AF
MHEGVALNRANWDERVAVHLRSAFYNVDGFRRGETDLGPIEAAEIGDIAGLRVAHLQCHFGMDTMYLARRGARVTGLDFSAKAIAAARALAAETGSGAEFVEGDVYDAPRLLGEGVHDLVFTSWGTIIWLPDIVRWAQAVAALLKPGGRLYFLDGHPAARALDQAGTEAPMSISATRRSSSRGRAATPTATPSSPTPARSNGTIRSAPSSARCWRPGCG